MGTKLITPAVIVELGINALATVRSLGSKGIPVIGVDSKLGNYAAVSKFCKPVFCRDVNSDILIETLIQIGKGLDEKGVLFCTSDLSLIVVSKWRKELNNYFNFVIPEHNVIETLLNKRLFYQYAREHGFTVPITFFTSSEEEIRRASEKISYPCLIKPEYRDEYWYQNVPPAEKVLFARSKEDFLNLVYSYRIVERNLIVQEWIAGKDCDVSFCLTYINMNHEQVVNFTGRKIRQHPALTGSTSCAVSTCNPIIAEESKRLFETIRCVGVCSVEFKYSATEKLYKITEPTVGRTDLQEGVAINAGVDIPYLAYLDAKYGYHEPVKNYQEGIKWFNEELEFYAIRNHLKKRYATFGEILRSYHGKCTFAIFNLKDPFPFIVFLKHICKRTIFYIAKHFKFIAKNKGYI